MEDRLSFIDETPDTFLKAKGGCIPITNAKSKSNLMQKGLKK